MKKIILTFSLFLWSLLQLGAETWTDSNGIIWNYSVYNGNAVQVGPNDKSSITGELVIPDYLDSYPVVSIADGAFRECNSLTSVKFPNSVKYIGKYTFEMCENLATITLPNSLINIEEEAFCECKKLGSLNLPGTLESIGRLAFCGCERLTTLTIPGSVETIGNYAFQNCKNILSLTISEGVKSIGYYAFAGLKITSLNIPKSVTTIDYSYGNPFLYCRSLESITVDADNPNYYSQNNSLIERSTNTLIAASINTVIPNGIKILGTGAFYGLPIETIAIPNTVNTIGNSAFSNCEELVSVTIPSSVTKIDNWAFSYCPKLGSINLSSGLTTIGEGAFSTNSNCLKSVIIPEGVTSIESQAFRDCYALEFVSLPSSLNTLLSSAFSGCNNLSEVEVNTISPIYIYNEYCFPNRANATLYVPAGSKEAYEAAQYWKDFENVYEIGYIGDVNSELTGETDIACFVVNRTGKLGNYFIQAGKPTKVKIIGEVSPTDLEALSKSGYYYEMYYTNYVDLSEANIHAGSYYDWRRNQTVNTPDNYLSAVWLGCTNYENDDTNWYGPSTIVLPNSLTEFEGWALTIYSTQTASFKTTVSPLDDNGGVCKFYVPSGTKTAWEAQTTYPDNVMFYDGPVKSITVQTAGTLSSLLTTQEIATVNELTVKGTINAVDFATMKKMKNLASLAILADIAAYEGTEGPVSGYTSYRLGEIPAGTFQNNENLKSVSVYQSTNIDGLIIGDYAFDGCTNLSTFNCKGFSSLGDFCFRNTKVKGALLLGNTYTYSDEEGTYTESNREFEHIGHQPFFGVKGSQSSWDYARYKSEIAGDDWVKFYELNNFSVIPGYWAGGNSGRPDFSGVTNKAENLLYSMTTTEKYDLTLPNSITTLADFAISGLQLKSINLSAVTNIGDGFLYQCPLLQSITCNNTAYKSVDGVLYSADLKTLVKYPCASTAESLIIPASVNQISKWAFEGSQNLRTIKIGAAVPPTLAGQAFEDFNVADITLYVPKGSKAAYQSASYWKNFKAIVEFPDADVNQDGEIDVVDVVDIARFVVGTPGDTFVEFLADLNSDDNVNVADAVVLVNEIVGDQIFAKTFGAPSQDQGNDHLTLTKHDDHSLAFSMESLRDYTAFQFDLYTNSEDEVMGLALNAARKNGHQLLYNKVDEGHYRVVALSVANNGFNGTNGELLNIQLDGVNTLDVTVGNIHFITTDGTDHRFDDLTVQGDATSIGVTPNFSPKGERSIYDLSGRKVSESSVLPKGVYIVNGKKVVIK